MHANHYIVDNKRTGYSIILFLFQVNKNHKHFSKLLYLKFAYSSLQAYTQQFIVPQYLHQMNKVHVSNKHERHLFFNLILPIKQCTT